MIEIIQVKETESNRWYEVTLGDGSTLWVPKAGRNRELGYVKRWLKRNPAVPYVQPPAVDAKEKALDALDDVMHAFFKLYAEDTGRTVQELKDAVKPKMRSGA